MGYIWQKLWDILGKNYGIYYEIYWLKIVEYILQNYKIYWSIGYIKIKLRDGLGKIMGYIGQKLWDILWDIFFKSYGIYLLKALGYICLYYGVYWVKLWDILWDIIGNIFKLLDI